MPHERDQPNDDNVFDIGYTSWDHRVETTKRAARRTLAVLGATAALGAFVGWNMDRLDDAEEQRQAAAVAERAQEEAREDSEIFDGIATIKSMVADGTAVLITHEASVGEGYGHAANAALGQITEDYPDSTFFLGTDEFMAGMTLAANEEPDWQRTVANMQAEAHVPLVQPEDVLVGAVVFTDDAPLEELGLLGRYARTDVAIDSNTFAKQLP